MSALLLTLGHNASAILVENGQVLCGYEEERLSLIKSDSRFPQLAIEEIQKHFPDQTREVTDVYISHWFPYGQLPEFTDKYFHPLYIGKVWPNARVHSVGEEFTHHDAHAWSATAFVQGSMDPKETMVIVADGFGNFGETMSVYAVSDFMEPILVRRSFGYHTSLGLMYQYATAFLDMKENQDEYKMLGYEAYVDRLDASAVGALIERADKDSDMHLKYILSYDVVDRYDPILAVDALPALRVQYARHFERVLEEAGMKDATLHYTRIAIAYYVQRRLEQTMKKIVASYGMKNLILVGGLFMNVKLNNVLSKMVDQISIMPLAGDQGAAIGLYHAVQRDFVWPDHVFWGRRTLREADYPDDVSCFMPEDADSGYRTVAEFLEQDLIVNLVRGHMEFGARALGNTSTLALPTKSNVEYINSLNARSTIMPMAPIVLPRMANTLFTGIDKVTKSLDYMICTREYRAMNDRFLGAAHEVPMTPGLYTGRPQLCRDEALARVLQETPDGMLINTSYNEHGKPICFRADDVIRCHRFQVENDYQGRVRTVVIMP